MATTGLSIPVFGKYTNSNGTITYSEGKTIGHAISYTADITFSENNNLRGDNMIIESDNGTFESGTLTLNTSEFTQDVSKWLLGLTENTFSYTPTGGTTAVSVTEYSFDDETEPLTCGFGIIEQRIIDDVTTYNPVVLTKVVPNIPADSATTRGETIEWQTKELTFSIRRDDSATHQWRVWAEAMDTEEEAINYLYAKLGVSSS